MRCGRTACTGTGFRCAAVRPRPFIASEFIDRWVGRAPVTNGWSD